MLERDFLTSIVIPVYNSENTIGPLADRLVVELGARFRIEIVFVNDGSNDGSEAVGTALCGRYPGHVRFFSLAKNFSEHNAVMAGLNEAKGDYAVIMDDDFQNPVSEAAKLIEYASRHEYDAVYTYYGEKKHSLFRNFGSKFNDLVADVMLEKPKDLYLSSFKIINRFLIDEVIRYQGPYPYIDGLILRATKHIGKIEVVHEERGAGKSGYTLKKLFSLWVNTFINFSILPLRIMTVTGFAFALMGFLLGIWTIIEKLCNLTPAMPLGYAFLAVLVSGFSGLQLMAIGMAGEYLGRIFLFQNKMPQYVIRRRIGPTPF